MRKICRPQSKFQMFHNGMITSMKYGRMGSKSDKFCLNIKIFGLINHS